MLTNKAFVSSFLFLVCKPCCHHADIPFFFVPYFFNCFLWGSSAFLILSFYSKSHNINFTAPFLFAYILHTLTREIICNKFLHKSSQRRTVTIIFLDAVVGRYLPIQACDMIAYKKYVANNKLSHNQKFMVS